jgi:hypothetical protein
MSAGLKLQGQFRFDLYDISGNLLKSHDYVNNFITNSGLVYPLHFAFADCFRFLSVGSGDAQNSIIDLGTTGLDIPIPELSYVGSRNDFYNSNSTNYAPVPSCGYRFPNSNIVELYRGWTLPNNSGGEDGVFKTEGTFKEFMVTPGRPYETGENGVKYCSCNEPFQIGKDCSSIADYYVYVSSLNSKRLNICDATNAFARVVLNDPINYVSGSVLNVTYKLTISINTGLRYQEMYYSNPGSENFNGNWSLVQGITQPGIKLINDGFINSKQPYAPNNQLRLQHFKYDNSSYVYDFTKEYGESFIPAHGIPLEPSIHNFPEANENGINSFHSIVYYFSQDNIQFLVSESGGKFNQTGEFAPWNIYSSGKIYSSGDYAYTGNLTYKYINQTSASGIPFESGTHWENLGYLKVISVLNSGIKKYKNDTEKALSDSYLYWYNNPSEFNIRYNNKKIPYFENVLQEVNFSNSPARNFSRGGVLTGFNVSERTVVLNRAINFFQYPFAQDFYIKSFVAAYRDAPIGVNNGYGGGDSGNFIPFLDCIFSGSGENIFIPQVITGQKDYDPDFEVYNDTGAFISGSNSNEYFYLNSNIPKYPILTPTLKWSSNCPSSVLGCPSS